MGREPGGYGGSRLGEEKCSVHDTPLQIMNMLMLLELADLAGGEVRVRRGRTVSRRRQG
jgi:hypothetical protein